MRFIRRLKRIREDKPGDYPYHLDCINGLEDLSLDQDMTIFIGENGTGKTTLLETIVFLADLVPLMPESINKTSGAYELSASFQLIWNRKQTRGFYLKSQAFITYVNQIASIREDTQTELEALKDRYQGRSHKALTLASIPYNRTLYELKNSYKVGLENMSHGEGYLELFRTRLVPNGLYILDEPELSLSPMRQLSLISLMKEMILEGCQFILITHSPILMAFEDAVIYDFSTSVVKPVEYESIEHVNITRDFLNNPQRYLRHL